MFFAQHTPGNFGFNGAFVAPIVSAIPLVASQRWQDSGNRYTLINVTAPTDEPVTLVDMKNWLRESSEDHDDEILQLITSARLEAENYCRRVFMTSTWRFNMDRFMPLNASFGNSLDVFGAGSDQYPWPVQSLPGYSRGFSEFKLPISPVQSIQSITYLDSNGSRQTINPSIYELDPDGYPATITPAYGQSWPAIRSGRYGVQINFTAGYGTVAQVPAPIKTWIMAKVATFYRNKESLLLFRGTIEEPTYIDNLLDPYRLIEF